MKLSKKIIISIVLIIFTILTVFTIFILNADAADVDDLMGALTPVKKVVKQKYEFTPSSYSNFKMFPLDGDEFNKSPDLFCGEHKVAYGVSSGDRNLGNGYHISNIITGGKANGKVSDPYGDIDTSKDVYTDKNGKLVRKNATYYGYKEKSEKPSDSVVTNWVYNEKKLSFDCESTHSGLGNPLHISDAGMAFLLARYKQTSSQRKSTGYSNDPLQHAVWDWINGNTEGHKYDADAHVFETYHEASKKPKVDCTPAENVGTTISGSTYTVGPFTMSDYVRAVDYKLSAGKYSNLQEAFGENYQGTVVKAEAVVTNESGAKKRIEFPVPKPNETFYINLNASYIKGYDELIEVVFTYQRIHASGNGSLWVGTQYIVSYTEASYKNSSCWYYCQDGTRGNYHNYQSPGSKSRPYSGTCRHYWYDNHHYDSCPGHTGSHNSSCPKNCTSNHTYYHSYNCVHHDTGYNSWYTHSTPYKCNHGHKDCKYFKWKYSSKENKCQDGFAGSGTLVIEVDEFTVKVSIPLKTVMEITKYIEQVDHVGESITAYGKTDERKDMTMDQKKNDPVYVERGDLVTYRIIIENKSRFPTAVKVKDTLPKACTLIKMPNEIASSGWIEVGAKDKVEYTVQVRPTKATGTDTNTIEFITKNNTAEHMKYVSWGADATHGSHSYGDIVNTNVNGDTKNLKEKDADTYKIKEYHVSIEKFIYNVDHQNDIGALTADYDSSMSSQDTRYNKSENEKESQPVIVEYGDRVTYKIKIYNTTNSYKDFNSREEDPYKEPDKVYVTVEDTLPKKYKDLDIQVSTTGYTKTENSGKFTLSHVMVPANGETTITVSLTVEESEMNAIEKNTAKFTGSIRNINFSPRRNAQDKFCVIKNNSEKTESADWYKLNYYNAVIDKYLYQYDESMMKFNNSNNFTNEDTFTEAKEREHTGTYDDNVIKPSRAGKSDSDKNNYPVSVEKDETITYAISIKNSDPNNDRNKLGSIVNGARPATQVRPSKVTETLQEGLSFQSVKAVIYKADGTEKEVISNVTDNGSGQVHVFTLDNSHILNPEEYIIYYVTVKVRESNMYLFELENKAELTELTNINNTNSVSRIVKGSSIDSNIGQEISREFVKMKDLVIAGKVWLDMDKNGLINNTTGTINVESRPSSNINEEKMLQGIVVKLYKSDGTLVRTTKTDESGKFTFGRDISLNWYNGASFEESRISQLESEQRIEKATNKDKTTGKYNSSSKYIDYYVEYEYDGVLYKGTTKYSNVDNLNNDGSFKSDDYKIDSNAAEFKNTREEFNRKYEYIAYNKAYGVNGNQADLNVSTDLSYEKVDHNAYLNVEPADTDIITNDRARTMTARSFIDIEAGTTNYLWLFDFPGGTNELPETEYLKYINLGLQEREEADISLRKDVYEVKTTVNGEEMIYDFNQDTDGEYVSNKNYSLDLYESDYKYRYEQYKNKAVEAYKGENSELNLEVTYKIAITNNAIQKDEYDGRDVKLDVKINELADYYDENFVKYSENNEYTVKVKDGDFLKEQTLKYVEAWYKESENAKERKDLSLSNDSMYSNNRDLTANGYNTLFIRGMDEITLKEGQTGYVFVKYTLNKKDTLTAEEGASIKNTEELKRYLDIFDSKENSLGIENIAEINTYSVWYEDGKPASIVDRDSAAGNIGDTNSKDSIASANSSYKYTNADDTNLYEDDTYKTGVAIKVNTETSPDKPYRTLSGFVWDDARTDAITDDVEGNQYIGDGLYKSKKDGTEKTKLTEAKSNTNIFELINKDGLAEYKEEVKESNNPEAENKDFVVKNARAEIYEIVRIKDAEGQIRYYEEKIDAKWPSVQNTRTSTDGRYTLSGFIPGYYIVKFGYGDTTSEEMLTFNGQDYKSTKYTAGVENATFETEGGNFYSNYDNIMEALEAKDKSDARDDEISRLKSISYSEIMTNEKADTLKGISTYGENNAEEVARRNETLARETAMDAETVTFYVKPEKLDTIDKNTIGNNQKNEAIEAKETYASRTNTPFSVIGTRTFNINNIDFGIQYRPESRVTLNKEVKSIEIITSDNKSLMKAIFKDELDAAGNKVQNPITGRVQRVVDLDNSVHLENIQFMCNDYKLQGFAYINIDDSLLQGSKIEVEYEFEVNNLSETDRVSENLNVLRYKENTNNVIANSSLRTESVLERYYGDNKSETIVNENNYLGSDTAQKYLYSITFDRDDTYAEDDDYRIIEKTMTTGDDNYYGKYLGGIYYTGEKSNKDKVVELKVDKILDYVDVELAFKATSNDTINHKWTTTTSEALYNGDGVNGNLVMKSLFENVSGAEDGNKKLRLVNPDGVAYDTDISSNLILSVDDRTSDTDDDVINQSISKFMLPRTIGIAETNDYKGKIDLKVEKIISSEDDTDNMSFENIAEIVQYTITSGRRTNFAITIGNAFWNTGEGEKTNEGEYLASLYEPDTAATEVIMLSPPTGLSRIQGMIRNTIDTSSKVIIISIVVLTLLGIGVVGATYGYQKYKNRPIK